MKKLLAILISVLMIVNFISCEKEEEEEGGAEFSCKLDGVKWEPNAPQNSVVATYTSAIDALSIVATKVNISNPQNTETIQIMIYRPQEGTITIGAMDIYQIKTFEYTVGTTAYTTDQNNVITLKLTKFDKNNKVVKGTFSGKIKNDQGDVIDVTDGKFDLEMQVY